MGTCQFQHWNMSRIVGWTLVWKIASLGELFYSDAVSSHQILVSAFVWAGANFHEHFSSIQRFQIPSSEPGESAPSVPVVGVCILGLER